MTTTLSVLFYSFPCCLAPYGTGETPFDVENDLSQLDNPLALLLHHQCMATRGSYLPTKWVVVFEDSPLGKVDGHSPNAMPSSSKRIAALLSVMVILPTATDIRDRRVTQPGSIPT